MTTGSWLLIAAGVLLLFGVGQRVLDKLRLTDRQALLVIALMLALGFLPDIALTPLVSVNLGGAVIPFILCLYLLAKAGTGAERARCVAATLITAVAVFTIGRFFPADPAEMPFDVNYLYGLAAGAIAYVFGRSRRGAFVAGTLGMLLADTASAALVWREGIAQRLTLGGAGAMDTVVIAGFTAVLLAELAGELLERAARGRNRPGREFRNGEFVERERGE